MTSRGLSYSFCGQIQREGHGVQISARESQGAIGFLKNIATEPPGEAIGPPCFSGEVRTALCEIC